MDVDWLFPIPQRLGFYEQINYIRDAVAADPAAAAIADDEAEEFFAVGYMLRSYRPSAAVNVWRAVGVPPALYGPKSFRRAVLTALRNWRDERVRKLLVWMIPNCGFDRFPDPAMQGRFWTEEQFAAAYASGVNPVWLVQVKRYLGAPDDWQAWLEAIDPFAYEYYRAMLDAGRLALRRLVYPTRVPSGPAQQAAAAVQPEMVESLREKDRVSGSLRQGVRQMEQTRKALRRQLKQRAQAARETLAQARGEVAAARRALAERLGAQEQELTRQARHFEAALATLRERLAAERTTFVRSLTALPKVDVLGGRPVSVEGAGALSQACRLLVESLGGRLVADGDSVTLAGGGGLLALERQLRDLALRQVQIRCDGLCRRKEGRPAIAAAGFVARLGESAALEAGSVVCCGPLASSLMAEFGGLAMALTWLLRAGAPRGARVEVWSDCRVMLSRLRQPNACRWTRGCVSLDRRVRSLLRQLERRGVAVTLRWVPRDEVDAADRLCDRTYRAAAWYHRRGGSCRAPLEAFLREVAAR